jgi:hypothetical protein
VIRTLCSPRRFARGLNSWEQQGHQHTDNGNHDQKLNKRETS